MELRNLLALAALATGVIGNVIYYCMLIGRGEMMKEYMASNANMNATIVEYVNGMEVIKAFNQTASSMAFPLQQRRERSQLWWGHPVQANLRLPS